MTFNFSMPLSQNRWTKWFAPSSGVWLAICATSSHSTLPSRRSPLTSKPRTPRRPTHLYLWWDSDTLIQKLFFLNNKITENYLNCNDGNYSFTNQWNEAEHICIAYIVSLSPIRIISWLSGARNVPTSLRITVLSGAATFTSAILAAGLPTKEKDRRSSKKVTITKRFNSN